MAKNKNNKIIPKAYHRIGKTSYVDITDDFCLEFKTSFATYEMSHLSEYQTKQLFLSLRNMYLSNHDKFWKD